MDHQARVTERELTVASDSISLANAAKAIQDRDDKIKKLEGFILAARTALKTNDHDAVVIAIFAAPVKG